MKENRNRVNLTVDLPDELLQAFLQHARDFDVRHSELVTMFIAVDGPSWASID